MAVWWLSFILQFRVKARLERKTFFSADGVAVGFAWTFCCNRIPISICNSQTHRSWITRPQSWCFSLVLFDISSNGNNVSRALDLKFSISCKNLRRCLERSCKTMHYSCRHPSRIAPFLQFFLQDLKGFFVDSCRNRFILTSFLQELPWALSVFYRAKRIKYFPKLCVFLYKNEGRI